MLKCPASITAVSTWDAEKRWHCMHNYILHYHLPYPSLQAVELMKSTMYAKVKIVFIYIFIIFLCLQLAGFSYKSSQR